MTPLQEVEEEFDAPHFDADRKTLGYWEEGQMIAYGRIWHRVSGSALERAYLQGFVDPEFRGRGIGRELFGWQVEQGRNLLLEVENDLPKYLRADEWDWIDESHRLYKRFGLEPVRYFSEMLRSLDNDETALETVGYRIVPWDRQYDRQALDVVNSAFADHWGSTPSDFESFEHRLGSWGVRLDLSFLAVATGGEVVGVALNSHFPEDEELLGRRDGWVDVLAVLREWRRKGIASGLLKTSFAAFSAAGFTHSAIGVDTENPTDAFRLYAGLGYEPLHRSITSELQVG